MGLSVGCGIDVKRMRFEYGRKLTAKPILGCGILLDALATGHVIDDRSPEGAASALIERFTNKDSES